MKWIRDWLNDKVETIIHRRFEQDMMRYKHEVHKEAQRAIRKELEDFKNFKVELECLVLRNVEESVGDRTNMWYRIEGNDKRFSEIDRDIAFIVKEIEKP